MKILQLCKYYLPDVIGGIEIAVKTLVDASASKDLQYTVVCLSESPGIEESDFVKIIRVPLSFVKASCPVGFKLKKELKKQIDEADVIHAHFPWPFGEWVLNQVKTKKPTLVTYHSDILKQKFLKRLVQPVIDQFLKRADRIVATSDNYLASSDELKPYLDKTNVIPLAAEDVSQRQYALRSDLPENYFLFLGVLRYYKGVQVLVEAAKGTDIPIVIAGDGPKREALEKLAAGASNIYFVGRVLDEEKYALLQHCRAFVLPSIVRTEAFGIVLLEAAQFSKPMITTELETGTSFVNKDQETGVVVAPNDVATLRHAMLELNQNEEQLKMFGANARKRFEERFTVEKYKQAYEECYRELATGISKNA